MIYANLTVGQLRKLLLDLPDEMLIIVNQSDDKVLDIGVQNYDWFQQALIGQKILRIDETERFPEADDDEQLYDPDDIIPMHEL